MRLNSVLRRALPLAVVLLTLVAVDQAQAQVAYTANTIQSLYYKEINKDGRIYVFNNPAEAERFEKSGETGRAITRIGVGPNGETVVADSETALELFFFKHGIPETVERPKPPTLNIAWRDGKTRMTIGSNFYLEMSNRIQVRYSHIFPDEKVKLPGTEAAGDSRGDFRVRRAKFKLEGWFYKPYLQYEFQANWIALSSANLGLILEDANINWDVTKGKKTFMVRFGQFKVPFGLQEITSSGAQEFVDRSLVSNFYFRGRETGLAVWGVLGNNKVEWRGSIANGAGQSRLLNDNPKFLYNGRVTWQPNGATPLGQWGSGPTMTEGDLGDSAAVGKPIFTVSFGFDNNNLSFVNTDTKINLNSTLFEVDTLFKYQGLFFTGSYIWGNRKPEAGAAKFDTSGFYVQAGYCIKKYTWEIAARYDQFDPSDLVNTDRVKEVGGVINYYYNKHNLKVQTDFRQIRTESATGETRNFEARLQTQFVF